MDAPTFLPAPSEQRLDIFAVASGVGAQQTGCQYGPAAVYETGLLESLAGRGVAARWDEISSPSLTQCNPSALSCVAEVGRRLAEKVAGSVARGVRFAVVGGDHSCAIGTWSGAARALRWCGPLGLVWVDAHLDSHRPQTSPSGALHGMPLAILLGQGAPALTALAGPQPAVLGRDVSVVGVRSFEPEEAELLADLGVRIFFMEELRRRGLRAVFAEACRIASQHTAGFGVSIDLDAIDPEQAPGVGCPVAGGLDAMALLVSMRELGCQPCFLGLEVTELNPLHDRSGATAELVHGLLAAMVGKSVSAGISV